MCKCGYKFINVDKCRATFINVSQHLQMLKSAMVTTFETDGTPVTYLCLSIGLYSYNNFGRSVMIMNTRMKRNYVKAA